MFIRRLTVLGVTGLLLSSLVGCSGYKVTFEVDDVINAPTESDGSRSPLRVDIVCLRKKDAENHPELARGTVMANEWFEARRGKGTYNDIPPSQILALRSGAADATKDSKVGEELVSLRDDPKKNQTVTVEFKHPGDAPSDAAMVIFGAFAQNARPLVIRPPGFFSSREYRVGVGRTSLILK